MQGEAVAVGGAGAHRQQVVVARDVAVPGQVVRVLRVTGNRPTNAAATVTATAILDDADGWFWEKRGAKETKLEGSTRANVLHRLRYNHISSCVSDTGRK